jgi:hypothetical protein
MIASALACMWMAADPTSPTPDAARQPSGVQSAAAEAAPATYLRRGLWGRPIRRGGFHAQVAFGAGGGPSSVGLFHAMELGHTFDNGLTLGVLHSFIQNRGIGGTQGGPDLFGGWMAEVKIPLFVPELVAKAAAGLGVTHQQVDGWSASGGVGWAYGLDFHVPFFERSGMTVGATGLQTVVEGRHDFGAALSLGYTWF